MDRLLGALTGNENEGNAQMVNQTKEVSTNKQNLQISSLTNLLYITVYKIGHVTH